LCGVVSYRINLAAIREVLGDVIVLGLLWSGVMANVVLLSRQAPGPCHAVLHPAIRKSR
jgi:hypothetical protein